MLWPGLGTAAQICWQMDVGEVDNLQFLEGSTEQKGVRCIGLNAGYGDGL